MPFVKLDCGILDSSLWVNREQREVFITALLMAVPFELEEAAEQIQVRTLERTGWVVPPGRYGLVEAAGVGIVRRALVDSAAGVTALEALCSPDQESRSNDFDGRRLARVDGGYLVLNYFKYRDFDYNAAERMRNLRERRKAELAANVRTNVTAVHPNVTHAEADAEKSRSGAGAPTTPVPAGTQEAGGSLFPSSQDPPKGARRGSRLPEDFTLTASRRAIALSEGTDPERTFAKFCDYWRGASGKNAVKLDWDATWRNWVRSEADRNPKQKTRERDDGLPTLNA